jgi:hypothetical protein
MAVSASGEELPAGLRHPLLNELSVPFVGPHVGRQEPGEAALDLGLVGRVAHELLDRAGIDPEVHAEEPVDPALEILGVARGQGPVLLHVLALRDEPRQVQEPRRRVGGIGGRQAGEDLARGSGDRL